MVSCSGSGVALGRKRLNQEDDGMTEQQAHKTLSDAGRKVLSEVLGESYLARRDATNNDFWGLESGGPEFGGLKSCFTNSAAENPLTRFWS